MRRAILSKLLMVLLLSITLAGASAAKENQGNKQSNGGAGSPPRGTANTAAPADLPQVPLAPPSDDYRLGVNDTIDVHVWKESELSRVVPVRPDGKISLPLVGELDAEGRTALELRAAIVERLKAYMAEPEVTVIVQQINSQRYFIMGEIASPGAYPLTVPTTVLQALSAAGGFREFADTDNITILRQLDGGGTERIRVNYKDWIKKKKQVEHFLLKNGDVILVP